MSDLTDTSTDGLLPAGRPAWRRGVPVSAPVPKCIADPSRSCHLDIGSHGPREVHDHPVSAPVPDATGDQGGALDLDAIEGRARALTYALSRDHIGAVASFGHTVGDQDVPALVAEVRRLRARLPRERMAGGETALWNQANLVGQAIDRGHLDGRNGVAVAAAIRATTPEEFARACGEP